MFKKFSLSIVAVALLTVSVRANDDLVAEVANLDVASISDVDNTVEDLSLDGLDVDALAANAGGEKTDAIEACFRRFGGYGGYGGYGHCNYGYSSYYSCYSTYYYPVYHCYRPVYHSCYYPVYRSYWGCW